MHGILKVDEIKNLLHNLVVLCETNILSLISQRLDNYYQIQTKYYSDATVHFANFTRRVWQLNKTPVELDGHVLVVDRGLTDVVNECD